MPEHENTNSDSSKADNQNNSTSRAWFRLIIVGGFVAFIGLTLISIYHPHLTERVKFFTTNALSLLVLAVILIQVLINRRQWEVMYIQADTMQRQLDAMNDQARFMSESLTQNERAVKAAEQNVELAKSSQFSAQLEAWNQEGVTNRQLDMMSKQTSAMQEQLNVMRDTLAETRRMFDLAERPIVMVYNATIPDLAPARPVNAMITLTNKGRAPAKNLSIFFRIAKPGYVYPRYPESEEHPVNIPFLGAGDSESIIDAPVNAITLDVKIYNSIVEGHDGLMIYGRGSYEDMAGRKYTIDEYAFNYHPKYKGFVPDFGSPALWKTNKALADAADDGDEQENPN